MERFLMYVPTDPAPFEVINVNAEEHVKKYKEVLQEFMKTVPEELHQSLYKANVFHTQGKLEEAESMYRELSVHAPNSGFILFCWGTLLCNMGRNPEGIQILSRSVEFLPINAEAWNNLGTAFKGEHQDSSAEECFWRSIELDPDNGGTWANLSGCYVNNGMPEKIIEYAAEALKRGRETPQAHNHMGLGLLELGRYKEAWPHWEWRRYLPDWMGRDRMFDNLTRFDGTPIPDDAGLWICGEQGVGDEILFAQCIQDGIRKGHYREDQLFIEFNGQVVPAMERSFPQAKVYSDWRKMRMNHPQISHYIESGTLPMFYRSEPEDFNGSPFVRLDPERVAYWRTRLEALGPGPYIGLTWQGGVKKTSTHLRAVPLETLKPLMRRNATFVSVQYGAHAGEATANGLPHWNEQAYSLDERYHLIAALDLMITVCQTGFHMAGSIGKEVWCLTPSRPAWRYSGSGERSVWYNSAVLLRQKGDDWKGLVHRVGVRLDKWLKEKANEVAKKADGKKKRRRK
jgi:hypothetical protein